MAKITPRETCVLIPAYNEAKHIASVIRGVQDAGFSVWVLDDGSTDETTAVAAGTGVRVLRSEKNRGKGACQRRGLEEWLKTNFKAAIFMDSDGQHDPADLAPLLEVLHPGRVDVAIGNRMENPVGMPRLRRATNRLMSAIVSLAARQKVPDSQCGLRALTREAVKVIQIRSDRFEAESEIILEASRKKLNIASLPIRSHYGNQVSHINPWKDTARFLVFLFRYLLTNFSSKRTL